MEDKVMEILGEINDEILHYEGNNYYDDGLLDSIQVIELVEQLETEFDIEIPPEMIVIENFASCNVITELVRKIIGES